MREFNSAFRELCVNLFKLENPEMFKDESLDEKDLKGWDEDYAEAIRPEHPDRGSN